jgi:hypothetical protein
MAGRQTIHDNGPVPAIVQWVLTVSAPLTVAAIIGGVVAVNGLKEAVNELKTQVTITNLNSEAAKLERLRLENRVTELERKWRERERSDHRQD